ncbi:MAG: glycogen/starch/alpha-glucan phosphorylase [Thermoprotei archaeon]
MVIVTITPEIYLEGLKTYAGGLGVLEGDKFSAASELGLNYIVLTLFYRRGYVDLDFKGEEVTPMPQRQEAHAYRLLKPDEPFTVDLKGEKVIIQPWLYEKGSSRAVLFEAECPMWARKLSDQVYIESSSEEQFLKYALLAKASARYIIERIGLESIKIIDLQEAHASLILFALKNAIDKFRLIIHTPGPWGHPVYPASYINKVFGVNVGGDIHLTKYALDLLGSAIVVSMKQRDILSRIFPEHSNKFKPITNGIYLRRWMHKTLYKSLGKGDISLDIVVKAREESKKELEKLLQAYKDGIELSDKVVVTWVRRLARYKRPYFIARFIEEHGSKTNGLFIIGGKPHPKDCDGLNYAKWFRKLHIKYSNVVFIHDYSVEIAQKLLQATDIFVFTPFSGWEACGTSYMKALVNGVPVISSRDGGAIEIVENGVNGWLFGDDLREFIDIYNDPRARDIDERDYTLFSKLLLQAIELYSRDPEKYWNIAFKAYVKTPEKVDIRNVLREYYEELI